MNNSLALLMFNRNDNSGIISNVGKMANAVDEIVIIDSSDPPIYLDLLLNLSQYGKLVSVHRAPPFGYVEPLRMYGIKKVNSSHILLIDADVSPSAGLVNFLRGTRDYDDLMYIPYYDSTFDMYYYSPALFNKGIIEFRGIIHEWPIFHNVTSLRKLSLPYRICGSTNLNMWSEKYRRYYFIESICRPFSYNYRMMVSKRSVFRKLGRKGGELSAIISMGFLALVPANVLRRDRSLWLALYGFRYNLNKYIYFRRLPKEVRNLIISISEDMHKNGGIIKYLNLDEVSYVESLTEQFKWNMSGIDLLYQLLKYRYKFGRPANDIDQLGSLLMPDHLSFKSTQ